MSPQYKVKEFDHNDFTDRNAEFERVETFMKERTRGVLIFEGERGSGKTTFLFELYRRFHERNEIRPFLISLFPYSAPEFASKENVWLQSEQQFQGEDIPTVLKRMARYLEIETIETNDRDFQKDYFARGLAYRASKTVPVLLVDSIYECPDETRINIEKYILTPLITSERVFIILSGRGKRPIWSRPELRDAEIVELTPLQDNFVIEQLEKLKQQGKSKRDPREYEAIADLSGGYPLIVRVLAEADKPLLDALDEAISIIIEETLPESERQNLESVRPLVEKLALVDIPFRIPDVEEYLYGNDAERRAKTNHLINLLLRSYLLRYEGTGYRLNRSVIYPIRKWLAWKKQDSEYRKQLQAVSEKLQKEYPSAKAWYQQMLPGETLLPQMTFNVLNTSNVR